jgi:hypothetical protein
MFNTFRMFQRRTIPMRSAITFITLLMMSAGSTYGQFYQGPASGSVPGGIVMNTNTFPLGEPLYPGPLLRPVKNKERVNPLPDPINLPPPAGPEGSNFFADPSVRGVHTGPPPITRRSFAGIPQTNAIPPDPHLAVGPNHIMQVVNTTFRISDKSGATLKTINADSWYGSLVPGVFVYDPKVVYDHFAGRWIMVWLDVDMNLQRGNYLISVSDDDNPLGVWHCWALPSTVNGSTIDGTWADYEGVGFDHRALYLTSNQFDFSGTYHHVKIRIINKTQLYAASVGAVTWTDFWDVRDAWGNPMIGTRPSISYSQPTEYYLVGNAPFVTATYMVVYKITDPLTNPSLSAVHVPVVSSGSAPNAGQPNGATPLEGGGYNGGIRCEPVYKDSSLWVVHAVRSGTANQFSSVRYVRIDVTSDVASEDVVFGAEGYWHIWPALGVDRDNNIAITFTRTSTSEFPAAAFSWRLDTDPPGLRPTEVFRPGVNTYVVVADNRNRWGDYMGMAVDPVDRNDFWMNTETVPALNTWGTWIHSMRVVPFVGARATFSSETLDFGSIEAGVRDTLPLTLVNAGSDPLTVSSLAPHDSAFSVLGLPALPVVVQTYDSLQLRVVFHPATHGLVRDTLHMVSNDSTRPPERIPLSGKGVVIGAAVPGVMYASSTGSAGSLYTINTTTGVPTLLGPTGANDLNGLAVHPATRELFGVYAAGVQSTLYRVSNLHGDALPVRIVPVPNMRAIAIGGGDTLYGGTTNGRLYRVNLLTGDTAMVGVAPGLTYSAFSFNPHTGALWASVRPAVVNRDRIYTVNTSTGEATLVGATGDGAITPSITFDALGSLYGLKGAGTAVNTLIAIDTLTAAGTLIGSAGMSGLIAITVRTDSMGSVDVRDPGQTGIPQDFVLLPNYPNPFNPETRIGYGLPEQSEVFLRVYDVTGREVALLAEGIRPAGFHSVAWNGTNRAGAQVASGVYFYALDARSVAGSRSFMTSRKMVLVR